MNNKVLGSSAVVNITALILNLATIVGLWFYFLTNNSIFGGENETWHALLFFIINAISIGVFIAFKGVRLLQYAARIILGGTLIVSGLIKGNDPKGFAYKLEEYFEQGAIAYRVREWGCESFNLEMFIPYALTIAIIIFSLEIILGVLTLIGTKNKLVSTLMVGMMLFFGVLTIHTAMCDTGTRYWHRMEEAKSHPMLVNGLDLIKTNPAEADSTFRIIKEKELTTVFDSKKGVQCVDDCGCFGDAMKGSIGRTLTPWESFGKDAVLLYFSVILLISWGRIKENTGVQNAYVLIGGAIVASVFSWIFGWWFILLFYFIVLVPSMFLARNNWGLPSFIKAIIVPVLLCTLLALYVVNYIPLKDYRPFAIGNDINEQLNNGYSGIYEIKYAYKHKETGDVVKFDQNDTTSFNKWASDTNYAFSSDDMEEITILELKLPSLTDFSPEVPYSDLTESEKLNPVIDSVYKSEFDSYYVDGIKLKNKISGETIYTFLDDWTSGYMSDTIYDSLGLGVGPLEKGVEPNVPLTDYLLKSENALFVFILKENNINDSKFEELTQLVSDSKENGLDVIVFTAEGYDVISSRPGVDSWSVHIMALSDTNIKAAIRSDLGVVQLKNGIVFDKWPSKALPKAKDL
jgi:uncharacterized membrane protein YphA (DoxX/SURF4 family)